MKICPRCSKTYTDENLNICLGDGSVLDAHDLTDNVELCINAGGVVGPYSGDGADSDIKDLELRKK